jgi:hypothetical protein
MAKLDDLSLVKDALKMLVKIVKTTYDVLSQAVLQPDQKPPPERLTHLSQTLEHISDIREGFMLAQRATPLSEVAELRYLAQNAIFDWRWLEELGLALEPGQRLETVGSQLIAYNHSLTVLGLLPRLPSQVITFPQPRPTYADVLAPQRPSQMLDRIEELERVLYRAGMMPLDDLAFDAVRRTYAFFEAGVWVINHHLAFMLAD